MRSHIKAALILSGLSVFWAGTAISDDGVDVKITNDGTEDILVTVYDMNTSPGRVVLTNTRINGFTSVPVSLVADASGRANLRWTATNTDHTFPKCGHANTSVANADSVTVHADSTCSSI
jgi:hypothetical protein